jgi:pyrroline-5-carboxylate reductase
MFSASETMATAARRVTLDAPLGATLQEKRIAVLGAGKMGGALATALVNSGTFTAGQVRATARTAERVALLEQQHLSAGTDNRRAAADADIVLLCLKPQMVIEVARDISSVITPTTIVISIATAVPTSAIEAALGSACAVIRAMPNTACRIGEGMTALCRGHNASAESIALAKAIFNRVGRTVEVHESLLNAVTALSASGLAFLYVVLEAMAEGGVSTGLSREMSTLLAAQAMLGAAQMVLATGDHPALLKSEVTTPAGCTIDGILELEDGKLRATLIRAVATTAEKASRLYRAG